MILAAAKAEAVHRAYRDVADTAAAATGDRVIAYPLKAKEIKDSEREAAVEDLREAAAGKPIDYSKAEIATTRDFSGIDMPTVTEPIATAIAGQPGLTEATVGPLILGCDSMFLLDGECYGKPHSEEVARERLRAMRGATGELWTGHCLIDFASGRMVRGASKATLHFCEYSDLDIERYIATGEPLEVAGSFTFGRFRRRVHRLDRRRSARHHRPEPAVGAPSGGAIGRRMDRPVERHPLRPCAGRRI